MHLITSGCSFSDPMGPIKWNYFLAKEMSWELHNVAQGSSGNGYISRSAIHMISKLMASGIPPNEITCVVMWSGIDRNEIFISQKESADYSLLINKDQENPSSFVHNIRYEDGRYLSNFSEFNTGWLLGGPGCKWTNKYITKKKKVEYDLFYTFEGRIIESYEHFLRLQWLCDVHNINLINLTYKNILKDTIDWEKFENIEHLYNMVDWTKWIFWKELDGFYEYTRDNGLSLIDDHFHPTEDSNQFYAINFLLNEENRLKLMGGK